MKGGKKLRKKKKRDADSESGELEAEPEEGMDSVSVHVDSSEPKRKKRKKNKSENDSLSAESADELKKKKKKKKKKMGNLAPSQPSPGGEVEHEASESSLPVVDDESPSHTNVRGDIMIGASPTLAVELSTVDQKKKTKHKELFQLKYEEWKKETREGGAR